ncbi:hypothetical protein GWN63_06110 [Candidatus Bathyarchaeota archaeon]|nr:hypothetical protein [Candidatus Bathyarchaeota archaeon]NIU81795.1 hypothetical protein [Candidatus Bathyarchaeota archaeon]NIV68434.1 hypothetical protein [Candidatus Bathyarchaeota archaeon]NIW16734.1 hypothetical protein [Candidatus Bathyarchaeota archaeon]NIW34933.1 hypothetical protein [Candidatus Bathyarchaeota archaeon]
MAKVVQTKLEEEEYRAFREALEKKGLSIREGLKLAVERLLEAEFRIDADDPFFTHKPVGRSSVSDLSKEHDKYLYGEENEAVH